MSNIEIGLLAVVIVQLFVGMYREQRAEKSYSQSIETAVNTWFNERSEWQRERKDLMDRIQAPTFAEYTSKVVREKKAEQPQEEEKRPEFIS